MKCAHTRIRASVALVLVAENGAEDKSYNLKKKKKNGYVRRKEDILNQTPKIF